MVVTPRRLVAALALVIASAAPLAAQDVVRAGRVHGVQAPSSLVPGAARDTTRFEFLRAWRQKTRRARSARVALENRLGPRLSVSQLRAGGAAVTGTLRVPVLLASYAGASPAYTTAQYQARLFGPGGAAGYTAKSYYQEVSRGAFTLDGTVSQWFALLQPASYYDPSSASDPTWGRTGAFLRDALTAADPGIDFGQFDNDGPDGIPNSGDDDGYVDVGAFLYPEAGRNCGGPGIWPHRWHYSGWWGAPFETNDPSANGGTIKVDDYLLLGGVSCDGHSQMGIGTFVHEMGHGLGLPDLYDTYDRDGTSQGLGVWDLMAYGNYLDDEATPAHMGAWGKDFLGWVDVQTVSAGRAGYALPPVNPSGTVLRYDIPNTREHFLLEHRERVGADAALPGAGLLVYRVDQAMVDSTLEPNRVNAHPRAGVALVQADGLAQLDRGMNRGDDGDPFPGRLGRGAFGHATAPASDSYDRLASGLELSGISLAGGTLRFDLATGPALQAPASVSLAAPAAGQASATIHLGASAGSLGVQAVSGAPWLTVTPSAGSAPADLVLTASAVGFSPGTRSAKVTLTAPGAVNSPVSIAVSFTVTGRVALSDSLRATLAREGAADTVQLSLTAGDRVDLGVWSEAASPLFQPTLSVVAPGGAVTRANAGRTAPSRAFVLGFTAPSTGTYRVVVTDVQPAPAYGGSSVAYAFRTRRAGPFLDVSAPAIGAFVPADGSTALAGVSIVNRGSAEAPFSASADSAFAGLDLGLGSVPAGVSAPVNVTLRPGSRRPGLYVATATFRLPPDAWNGDVRLPVYLRLHDPAAVYASHPASPRYAAVAPDGALVVEDGSDLVRIDPATGAASTWVAGLGAHLGQMQFGPDGGLYVADYDGRRVLRVDRDGSVSTALAVGSPITAVAVLPDGTVYAADAGALVGQVPGGTPQAVLSTPRAVLAWSLAYRDGWLYYAGDGELRRFNVATRADEHLSDLPDEAGGTLLSLVAGAGGRLYGAENNPYGAVLVMGPGGAVVDRVWGPAAGAGVALGSHWLYGAGRGAGAGVWRVAVDDAAAPAGGFLVGDPSGDGRITSVDAAAVRAYLAGRPVPAGWNVPVAGDADCDGVITDADVQLILAAVVRRDVAGSCVGRRR